MAHWMQLALAVWAGLFAGFLLGAFWAGAKR